MNVHVLAGKETFLMEEEISAIKKTIRENADMNTASYNAEDIDRIETVIEICRTLPFLSEKRLVILHNFNKLDKKNLTKLLEYIKNPCEETILVLTIEGEKAHTSAVLKKLPSGVAIKTFEALKGPALVSWIERRARSSGKKIGRDAASLLAESSSPDAGFLSTEIEKLCLFTGEAKTIGIDDVRATVVKSHEASVFEFTDALFAKKKIALSKIFELEDSGIEPLQLISLLENQTIQHIQVLFGKTTTPKGVHPFVAKKILSRKSLWKLPQLERLLADIRKVEVGIKTGKTSHPFAAITEAAASAIM